GLHVALAEVAGFRDRDIRVAHACLVWVSGDGKKNHRALQRSLIWVAGAEVLRSPGHPLRNHFWYRGSVPLSSWRMVRWTAVMKTGPTWPPLQLPSAAWVFFRPSNTAFLYLVQPRRSFSFDSGNSLA